MKYDKYPTLLQLFSCYFHQDWPEEFDSPSAALDAFIESESEEYKSLAHQEIVTIINNGYRDDEILDCLAELGCYYEPTADYSKPQDWLKSVEKKLGSQ